MYDFIDIGSSKGGSMNFARNKYGPHGYGIDIDPKKVKIARSKGYDVREQDIFEISDTAKVVTIIHTLEHLPDKDYCYRLLEQAARIGDRLYITYPNFESDAYLYDLGYRFFWSYWTGHTLHLSRTELHCMLMEIGLDFSIDMWGPVSTTSDDAIVPLDAPIDVLGYDSSMDDKEDIKLINVHREVRCEAW